MQMWHKRLIILVGILVLAGCNLAQNPEEPTPEVLSTPTTNHLTCSDVVKAAVKTASAACDSLSRNQACYGNTKVEAQLQPNAQTTFNSPGDIVGLTVLKRLSAAPLDEQTQIWGISVLKAQANLPDILPGQNVTFLLFGDATINNISSKMDTVILKTGLSGTTCTDAPDAVLLQAPEKTQATLKINGASITLGSTLYLTATQNGKLTIATIEGAAIISAFNTTRIVQPGAQTSLPLGTSDGLQVIGPPSELEPYDLQSIQHAPLSLLERRVVPPVPIASPPASQLVTSTIPATFQPERPSATSIPCTPRADWAATYAIQSGDTLSVIARRYQVSLNDLITANCIADPNVIQVGQVLKVPFQLPTTAPSPMPTATLKATAAAIYANPNLRADNTFLQPQDCATLQWDIDNISQIYFEQKQTSGHQQQRVCPAQTTTYTLLIVYTDGKQIPYSITIQVALPFEPASTPDLKAG
jgi:LysM repeat protein